jgi:hypothetical protein
MAKTLVIFCDVLPAQDARFRCPAVDGDEPAGVAEELVVRFVLQVALQREPDEDAQAAVRSG